MEVIQRQNYGWGRWMVGVRHEDGTVRWYEVSTSSERTREVDRLALEQARQSA